MIRQLSSFIVLAFLLGGLLLAPAAATASTLTGAVLMNTDVLGNAGSDYWNTLAFDGGIFNLYLKNGAVFVNNGEGAGTRININLPPGSYTFNIFAEPGSGSSFGLNLFFNGNDNTPGISVFAPVNTSGFGPNPGTTRQLNGVTVAGANTNTFVDGSTTVVLGGFNVVSPVAGVSPDLVDAYNNVPNGNPDFTGSFTLRVTGPDVSLPEPASLMLLGSGLVGLLAASRRLSRA